MTIDRYHDQRAADREHIARVAQAEGMGWEDEVATLSSLGFAQLFDKGLTEQQREALAQAARRATTWREEITPPYGSARVASEQGR